MKQISMLSIMITLLSGAGYSVASDIGLGKAQELNGNEEQEKERKAECLKRLSLSSVAPNMTQEVNAVPARTKEEEQEWLESKKQQPNRPDEYRRPNEFQNFFYRWRGTTVLPSSDDEM